MKRKTKTEKRWFIVGNCGLYVGQWLTRIAAIHTHTSEKGRDWRYCRAHGDRAVKLPVTYQITP
jgi:hypothetical protein